MISDARGALAPSTIPPPVGRRLGVAARDLVGRLRAGGIPTARQDAELLLEHVLGVPRLTAYLEPDRELPAPAAARLEELAARRLRHEPVQYLIGETEFCGLRLAVGSGVFIPRPETEILVERAVAAAGPAGALAVDLCAGSAAVACAVARRCPELRIWAVELDARAADWARANVRRLGLTGRVTVLEGDLGGPLAGLGLTGRCDLVVANPPYLADAELPGLPEEVRLYEPRQALAGGPDGLAVIDRILALAPRLLRPGGRLLAEVGHDHAGRLRSRLVPDPRYRAPRFHRDLLGCERVLDVEVT